MPSYAITVEVAQGDAEDCAALFLDQGAQGAEVHDGSIEPMPGAPRPLPGRAYVVAFFARREEAQAAGDARGLGGGVVEIPDQDWGATWREGLAPALIGRVYVRPSWIAAPPPPGTVEVILDPGMAFGTGTHPTTRLCLEALGVLLVEMPGVDVLDVGTGSGLLAIAAKKLGARRVAGTEEDVVALRVAEENADQNGVVLELRLDPPEAVPGSFPIVVANILANTLVALAPAIASRVAPGGVVLLAGVLAGQEEEVRAAYAQHGLVRERARERSDGEWRLLAMRAPGPGGAGGAR
jgi:ribosomal protein L11 methyltransferase